MDYKQLVQEKTDLSEMIMAEIGILLGINTSSFQDKEERPFFQSQQICYLISPQKIKAYRIGSEIESLPDLPIPEGQYFLKLRTEGGFHNRYKEKFSEFHKGMLQLSNVRGTSMVFTNVLIHVGNTDDDSAGCILVGNSTSENLTKDGFIGQSTTAYKRIYKKIYSALNNG